MNPEDKPKRNLGPSKITDSEARAIYDMRDSGRSITSVAKEFQVSPTTVSKIQLGKIWNQTTGAPVQRPKTLKKRKRNRMIYLSENAILGIHALRSSGQSISEVAEEFRCGPTTVRNIWSGHSHSALTEPEIKSL